MPHHPKYIALTLDWQDADERTVRWAVVYVVCARRVPSEEYKVRRDEGYVKQDSEVPSEEDEMGRDASEGYRGCRRGGDK